LGEIISPDEARPRRGAETPQKENTLMTPPMAGLHPLQKKLAPLLAPLSLLYGTLALARRRLTERGLLPCWTPPIPCVSVGNISWGGTGKTPITDWLLQEAAQRGLKAAVLSRGYGGRPPHLPLSVSSDLDPAQCGDEPFMLALRHPEALILVDPDRCRAARQALSGTFGPVPDILVLDDGFQRVSLARELNLVLLDADDVRVRHSSGRNSAGSPPSCWNRVLPWGSWREPAASLSAASAFLIRTEVEDWPGLIPDLAERLQTFPRPVFAFCMKAQGLRRCGAEGVSMLTLPPDFGPYLLISGVGNPRQVRRTVQSFMGYAPARCLEYPDHYDFAAHRREVLETLRRDGQSLNVVCTAKDAVKLGFVPRLHALDVIPEFFAALGPDQAPVPAFPQWFGKWLETRLQRGPCEKTP